jgi:DNA-directed RNA polymerase specialized sigma24 family protein
MTCPRKQKSGKQETDEYSSVEDFRSVFAEGRTDLYGLSFQLTGDHDQAEQCFVAGREDCFKATRVFKEWAGAWAKRTIIQNAIRKLKPRPSIATSSVLTVPICIGEVPSGVGTHFQLHAVLALEDFERFVFVMSVLERYSEHDCSLLLDCPRRHIDEARTRAFVQLTGAHRTVFPSEIHLERVQEINR